MVFSDRNVVDEDASRIDIVQTEQEFRERGFAGAIDPHNCDALTGGDVKILNLERKPICFIRKTHILESNIEGPFRRFDAG